MTTLSPRDANRAPAGLAPENHESTAAGSGAAQPTAQPHPGALLRTGPLYERGTFQPRAATPTAPTAPRAAEISRAALVPRAAVAPSAPMTAQTREVAAQLYAMVSERYLAFRREYYRESDPSLDTLPHPHSEIHQAELARVSESTLRLLPPAIKSLPVLGGLIQHLEQVADLHSISEGERTGLHNLAMTFLHGVEGGIQPWFVTWMASAAKRLSTEASPDYFMDFPWDGLMYRSPAAVAELERAIATSDVPVIVSEVTTFGDHLARALADPIHVQPDLAFTGPDADHRRVALHFKTAVALALVAYLIVAQARNLLHPPHPVAAPKSLRPAFPAQVQAHLMADDQP